jgi:hypothetical protein
MRQALCYNGFTKRYLPVNPILSFKSLPAFSLGGRTQLQQRNTSLFLFKREEPVFKN